MSDLDIIDVLTVPTLRALAKKAMAENEELRAALRFWVEA